MGGKGGKGGKATGQDVGQKRKGVGVMEDWEKEWIDRIAKSQWGLQGRCKFYDCTCGCSRDNCQFKNECLICGQHHPLVQNHAYSESEPWA